MGKRIQLQSTEFKLLREQVLARDHFRCRVCKSSYMPACHHIIFKSDMGSDTSNNLVVLCPGCHNAIHGLVANNFIVIVAADNNDETVPDANAGLVFRKYKKVGKRIRWRQ